jgi:hypothetical protein
MIVVEFDACEAVEFNSISVFNDGISVIWNLTFNNQSKD